VNAAGIAALGPHAAKSIVRARVDAHLEKSGSGKLREQEREE
jgi:hypothetical protein